MINLNIEFRLSEQLNTDDKQLMDKLRSLLYNPILRGKENTIRLEDQDYKRSIKINFSNNSNTAKINSISFNEYNTVFKTNFVFEETDKATLPDMTEVDFGKFNHYKLGAHNWFIVHTILMNFAGDLYTMPFFQKN